jgi:myo-inositol-1(or 4)-monophosphatase
MYVAERGSGAFLNGRRLRVSGRRIVEQALFATGIPFKGLPDHPLFLHQLAQIMVVSSGVRRFGSAALDLAYVAAGRYDGFWENGLNPWDIAAGIVLVREAGGFVTDLEGGKTMFSGGGVCAVSSGLQAELLRLLAEAKAAHAADIGGAGPSGATTAAASA